MSTHINPTALFESLALLHVRDVVDDERDVVDDERADEGEVVCALLFDST